MDIQESESEGEEQDRLKSEVGDMVQMLILV